jgi:hypothetical protein
MRKRLVYPPAGGGNHVRWLMYFDKSFDPMHLTSDKSPDNKLKFIETKIYPKERTWHNWLTFEWKHRRKYDHIIALDSDHHTYKYKENNKTIIMSFNDYTECIKKFVVIISQFTDNWSIADIIEEKWAASYDAGIKLQKISPFEKVIASDVIWEDVLNKKFYYDIIDFWELEDHYEYAARVHKLWRDCQKQALVQFIESCKNDEYINFLKV